MILSPYRHTRGNRGLSPPLHGLIGKLCKGTSEQGVFRQIISGWELFRQTTRGHCLQESCRNRAQGLARKVVAFEERAYDAGCNPVPYRVRDDDGIVFVHVLDSGCDFGACAKYRIFMLSMCKTHSEVY